MDHFQADIDSLHSERGELKEKLKMYSRKPPFDVTPESGTEIQPSFFREENLNFINVADYVNTIILGIILALLFCDPVLRMRMMIGKRHHKTRTVLF